MSSSATGVGMTICFLGAILLILTQKSSQKFGDVLGIMVRERGGLDTKKGPSHLCKSLPSCTFPSDSSLIGLYLIIIIYFF